MTHVNITINNHTLFDGELNPGLPRPPQELAPLLTPNTKPEPWMKSAQVALADALLTGRDIAINVNTQKSSWGMLVNYG